MKNFKKIVAGLSATAIAMTMGVSAFAATASYEDGYVKVADTAVDAENQWTVIVIDKAKQNATLTENDLYYINQGTSADGFWATDGMGTKIDLADPTLDTDEDNKLEYIVRIGSDKDGFTAVDIPLTIELTPAGPTYKLGDVNADTEIDTLDALAVLKHFAKITLLTTDAELAAANVNKDTEIDTLDALAILKHFAKITLITSEN